MNFVRNAKIKTKILGVFFITLILATILATASIRRTSVVDVTYSELITEQTCFASSV